MCGIAGAILSKAYAHENAEDFVVILNSTQRHRGPDADGIYIDPNDRLALGHNRLSIIDLSASANQPMISSCDNFVIVYNGEIYNFKSIKDELISLGAVFNSQSDTEVLLQSLIILGQAETLRRLRGMYAFAFYDRREQTVTISRDYIGEKPLHYCINERGIAFSSELKALFQSGFLRSKRINNKALAQYLRYGYISAPDTIINDCFKLAPGHSIAIDLQNLSVRIEDHRKTILPEREPANVPLDNYAQAIDQLDGILNEVIDRQSISDVPLGAFLSGGVDSSLVTAILQGQSSTAIDTFTIAFDQKEFNEAPYAEQISKHLGTRHNEICLSDDLLEATIQNYVEVFDEPFADSSALPSLILSAFARQKVITALSGDGGDELFGGYNRYFYTHDTFKKLSKIPDFAKRLVGALHDRTTSSFVNKVYYSTQRMMHRPTAASAGLKLQKLVASTTFDTAADYYTYLCSYWPDPRKLLLNKSSNGVVEFSCEDSRDSLVENAMQWDMAHYLPGDNLVKTDRSSMFYGLEVRVPILDLDVLRFSREIPMDYKIDGSSKKRILKDVLYSYLPKDYTNRPKMGFSPPISSWINGALSEQVDSYLGRDYILNQELFDHDTVRRSLADHRSGFRDNANQLWALFIFQKWYERHYATIVVG